MGVGGEHSCSPSHGSSPIKGIELFQRTTETTCFSHFEFYHPISYLHVYKPKQVADSTYHCQQQRLLREIM